MAVPKPQQKTVTSSKSEAGIALTPGMVMQRLNDNSSRLRLVEERVSNNRERIRVFDDDLLDFKKKLTNNVKDIEEEIEGLKKNIKILEDNIHHIIKELELTAKKQDVNVIEKYVNLMDPTRYVTKEEVLKLIEKK